MSSTEQRISICVVLLNLSWGQYRSKSAPISGLLYASIKFYVLVKITDIEDFQSDQVSSRIFGSDLLTLIEEASSRVPDEKLELLEDA